MPVSATAPPRCPAADASGDLWQPWLLQMPIKLDALRLSDQIRARCYADQRLSSACRDYLKTLGEFVSGPRLACWPGPDLVEKMTGYSSRTQKRCRGEARDAGVLDWAPRKERRREGVGGLTFYFQSEWMARFEISPAEQENRQAQERQRRADKRRARQHARADATLFEGANLAPSEEAKLAPSSINRVHETVQDAAVAVPRDVEAQAIEQQQQVRLTARFEGLIGACAARARAVGRIFDEVDERRRFAAGEISVADLQALADKLNEEVADLRYRQAYGRHR